MEDSKKKRIMIGIIVIFIAVAGLITFARRGGWGGSIDAIPDDKMTWVKCANPSCKAEYQMSEKKFLTAMQERLEGNTNERMIQALTCKECGKNSIYQAYKCPSCGTVFVRGVTGSDFPDTCPKCGHSEMEQNWKKRRLFGQE
jgi:RNA polymerase subunit RPABC4/transcription elongation factor Spt4